MAYTVCEGVTTALFIISTVGPRLSGHQLSGYISYTVHFSLIYTSNLAQNINKVDLFYFILYACFMKLKFVTNTCTCKPIYAL